MLWRETVEAALQNLGGVAPLRDLYIEARKVRIAENDSTPDNLASIVRRELEYNSSDSTQWQEMRDIFFSVHGVGGGVWGLRSLLGAEPAAVDIGDPTLGATPGRMEITTSRIIRDTLMSQKIKALHRNECQICSLSIELPDGRKYAEGHHIIPLGKPHNGDDHPSNLIVVCPNHHAMLDMGCIQLVHSELVEVNGHIISKRSIEYHNSIIAR